MGEGRFREQPSKLYRIMELLDAAGVGGADAVEQVRNLIAENERLAALARAEAGRPDLERMLLALESDPTDALLPIADACLDAGEDALARGWGWLAMTRKWPTRNTKGEWRWFHSYAAEDSDVLPPGGPTSDRFISPRLALEFVALAIAEGRWVPPARGNARDG